jgi:hypothetical protein
MSAIGAAMVLGEHTVAIPHVSYASNSADGRTAQFVAYRDMKVKSVFWAPLNTAQATKGTATTSASYRRLEMYNGGTAGTVTTSASRIASLNLTASLASSGFRAFDTVNTAVTVAASSLIYFSHSTVGAATADGTELQAGTFIFTYESI